ncbi:MAG: beta-N-acetylhexosaminidase, partial [Caldiserica bacterium]|nr:beta-N-acetylhexosaminidase [Caldisericota bacterium]
MLIIAIYSCTAPNQYFKEENSVNIIPKPNKISFGKGEFIINKGTKIIYDATNNNINNVAEYLNDKFLISVGYKLENENNFESANDFIKLNLISKTKLGHEGYQLKVNENGVEITGDSAGLFYGVQSLLQLLPPEIFGNEINKNLSLKLPFIEIEDIPRFAWRGMHLDVCRHIFPIHFIKKYIDYLAFHKLNVFHWHLTDDQGWRIEIKKYPKLTEISAFRNETIIGHHSNNPQKFDGKKYGGFYTQEQIKEIVKYASDRFITVVPEIEMPGHSVAALTAYPEISCTGGPFDVRTSWGISDDIFCGGNEKTFEFIENVLSEVVELFPSKFIHIGGDEAPKIRWEKCPKCQKRIVDEKLADEHELQSYFIQRIEKYLNSKGKKIIGWDEILEGGLASKAAVMSWRGNTGGILAAQQK